MINLFSMMKRVVSRLEKFTFDRVWNEPYAEYRTNTRPRILNRISEVSRGTDTNGNELVGNEYAAAAGVLIGEFEQITLPSADLYYVYAIEDEQFRSIKVDMTSWVKLADYCNLNRMDMRVYSDSGVFLWRGGIYIKKNATNESILIAVDATMLHRCLDTYSPVGDVLKVTKRADPTCVFFTKYVDSDSGDFLDGSVRHVNDGDNQIECKQLTANDINEIKKSGTNPVRSDAAIAFYNGRVLNPSGGYSSQFTKGGYVESFVDPDILYDGYYSRGHADCPIYSLSATKKRVLFHVPRNCNPNNYLITYNTCDLYLIPKTLTAEKLASGFEVTDAGVIVHMTDREENFHQLTHNDFSVDLDLLDSVAAENGFVTTDYYIHFVIRHHGKKLGLTRDANYCDILYSQTHTDSDIIKFLLGDASVASYNLSFWKAAYLEENSKYAKAMLSRVGSTVNLASAPGYYRPTVDRFYKAGKTYYVRNVTGNYTAAETVVGSPITEGVMEYTVTDDTIMPMASTLAGSEVAAGMLEKVVRSGIKITPANQCEHCKMRTACTLRTTYTGGKMTGYSCPDFAHWGVDDFIQIYGYYNMLQLICRRVTTYKVLQTTERVMNPDAGTPTGSTIDGLVICKPTFATRALTFPVRVPLALYDLIASEWHPIVYLNGDKIAEGKALITGETSVVPDSLEEVFWTYTPGFDDEIFWDTDQRRLVVTLDSSIEVKPNDYVAIELIPNPSGATVDPIEISSNKFNVDDTTDAAATSSTLAKVSFEPIGSTTTITKKNSELVFLNGKQLVANIDYMPFSSYTGTSIHPIVQNISYLERDNNLLDIITTTDTVIGTTKGFVLGNEIEWDGVSPFFFDNMSILTVGGKVVSNFSYDLARLTLEDGAHENGEPYMVRTSVPQKVLELITNATAQAADVTRMNTIRSYFDAIIGRQSYRAVIPYSHKVYSTYLLAIIKDMVKDTDDDPFDFELLEDDEAFIEQFAAYESKKSSDVVYSGLTTNDLRFVDVYPIYHAFNIVSPVMRRKIAYLVEKLMPGDTIRHREHINGN